MHSPAEHPETRRIAANGLEFDCDVMGTGGRVALCLHGFPESRFSWRHQLPLLARLGYTALAPDQRGYGGSSRPEGVGAYHIDHLVADAAAIARQFSDQKITLIAHDWGAIVAWHIAMRKALPLERLVIMNVPHPACYMREARRGWAQLRKSWYVLFFQLPWLPEALLGARGADAIGRAFADMAVDKSRFPEEVLEHYRANARIPGALTAMINWYRAAFRAGSKTMNPAENRVDVPTLLVWGEEDTALDRATTLGTEAYVPDLTVRYLPGVSHWVQQEAPESVNAMLEAFLTGRPVPEHRA